MDNHMLRLYVFYLKHNNTTVLIIKAFNHFPHASGSIRDNQIVMIATKTLAIYTLLVCCELCVTNSVFYEASSSELGELNKSSTHGIIH